MKLWTEEENRAVEQFQKNNPEYPEPDRIKYQYSDGQYFFGYEDAETGCTNWVNEHGGNE